MLQRTQAGWVATSRFAPAGIALVIILVAATLAMVNDDEDLRSELTERASPAETAAGAVPGGTDAATAPGSTASAGAPGASSSASAPAVLPGLPGSRPASQCSPSAVNAPGVTRDTITIGQIVTDNPSLPQQLRPAHEGLTAFVQAFNAAGGLCGRKLVLEYRNDNGNPATHNQDARELAGRVLAFVANESLLDFLDYQREAPFEPTVEGGGGKVPDVGGLAFGYGRSQSRWHAGVIGSVSPVLVGGGQYRGFVNEAREAGTPCRKGGVVHLREPTGASEDQARLGQVSLEAGWGAGMGAGNTQLYAANLGDPVPAYEVLVDRMVDDGMNCVFTYTDLQSSINMARAMYNQGVWPPERCRRGQECFRVFSVVLSVYDRKFIADAGPGARGASTFIPHVPLVEMDTPAMKVYLDALAKVRDARPSTFSIIGFASGLMLIEALQKCPDAPTRACLISGLRSMKDFTAGGLLGGTTPFRTTKATLDPYGTYDWKWIFNRSVAMRVLERNGKLDFHRIGPPGFFNDRLHVARGSPG